MAINKEADGQISNAPPPPKLANSSLTAFQLIAFNELFEVAFFNSIAQNITNNVTGFQVDHKEKSKLINILDTVIAVSVASLCHLNLDQSTNFDIVARRTSRH